MDPSIGVRIHPGPIGDSRFCSSLLRQVQRPDPPASAARHKPGRWWSTYSNRISPDRVTLLTNWSNPPRPMYSQTQRPARLSLPQLETGAHHQVLDRLHSVAFGGNFFICCDQVTSCRTTRWICSASPARPSGTRRFTLELQLKVAAYHRVTGSGDRLGPGCRKDKVVQPQNSASHPGAGGIVLTAVSDGAPSRVRHVFYGANQRCVLTSALGGNDETTIRKNELSVAVE